MLRSFYIGATGMKAQRAKMNTITNNIVNVETVGYKKDQMITRSFEDMMLIRLNDGALPQEDADTGPLNTGTHIDEVKIDWNEGMLQQTTQPTDMAIVGEGFFEVMTPDGLRYTRAGNFNVDVEGNLVTQEGYYVVGVDGGMISPGTGNFVLAEDGTLSVNGQYAGRVRVVTFEDLDGLRKMGDNTFVHESEQPTDVAAPTVKQSFVEGSNVDIAVEVTDMLMTNRIYESNQRILKMVDQSLEKTVNEIARF